jgi:hypothetical protein
VNRTTIMLPPSLKRRAAAHAQSIGVSLGELIRHALEAALNAEPKKPEGTMFDLPTFKGPRGVSADVPKALYGRKRR